MINNELTQVMHRDVSLHLKFHQYIKDIQGGRSTGLDD